MMGCGLIVPPAISPKTEISFTSFSNTNLDTSVLQKLQLHELKARKLVDLAAALKSQAGLPHQTG